MVVLFILLFAIQITFCQQEAEDSNLYDVIIMGAGMAGISAAKTLYAANITNILIIEAQNYIGGRINITNFSNHMVNIGASWIHGACINITNKTKCSYDGSIPNETNPMLIAADKYNISYVLSDYDDEFILNYNTGNEFNITKSDNTYHNFHNAQECIFNITENIERNNIDDMSYFAALYLCGWKRPHSSIEKSVEFNEYSFEYAQHTKWSSTYNSFLDTKWKFGTQDLFITDPRGYKGVIDGFVDDSNLMDKIILNSPINAIRYNENNVSVIVNDTIFTAKYGIVTFSLGVLQSDLVQFIPKLPSWKIDAVLEMDMTDYTPIYVKWPHNFWNDTIVNITEFIILDDDRFAFFTWIYNLNHPNIFNNSLIWRFDIVLDIAQMVQFENINDTIKLIIDLKLSHYFETIPDPEEIFVASWRSNKYTQGSYSNYPTNFDYNKKLAIQWPLLKTLFFAGEAMMDDNGYVHSAYYSGIDNANKILSCYGYDLSLTDGLECPKSNTPPFIDDNNECHTKKQSTFKQFAWLWVIIGLLLGSIVGCIGGKYCKITPNESYNSVEDEFASTD